MKMLVLGFSLFAMVATHANVVTNDGFSSVNIITKSKNSEYFIKFEYCQAGVSCRYLGSKEYYSLKELEEKRFNELLEVAYAGAADVVIAVASGLLIFFTWGYAVGGIAEIPAYVALVAGPVVASQFIGAVNPMEQWRQADTLSEMNLKVDVVTRLPREIDLYEFVSRLDLVLNKVSVPKILRVRTRPKRVKLELP